MRIAHTNDRFMHDTHKMIHGKIIAQTNTNMPGNVFNRVASQLIWSVLILDNSIFHNVQLPKNEKRDIWG